MLGESCFLGERRSGEERNPLLKRFHDRLAATGKIPKFVIVAVMRKMITTLNAGS
jgi:hypothetical protein